MVALENGRRWRLVGAGDWEALEYTNQLRLQEALSIWLAIFAGHVACFRPWQAREQEMKAMRLTRNEHHRKLRVPIRDISDWLVNADVSYFYRSPAVSWRYTFPVDSSTFRTSTITCFLPRLPAASTTASLRPSLMTAQNLGDFQKGHNKEKHLLTLSALL
jgi:hypothetical protein